MLVEQVGRCSFLEESQTQEIQQGNLAFVFRQLQEVDQLIDCISGDLLDIEGLHPARDSLQRGCLFLDVLILNELQQELLHLVDLASRGEEGGR